MPPLTLMVKPVSGRCNMACHYCFYADEMKNRAKIMVAKMEDSTLENLIKKAFAYAEHQLLMVFQGGEPTLAGYDFYRRVLELEQMYNSRKIPVIHTLQTNGYQLDDNMLEVLKRGHFLVGVSMDGTRSIHDARRVDYHQNPTYDKIKINIER